MISTIIETLMLPLNFAFIQKALMVSVLVAIPMSLLSCYLVLRGWALMGDAISHSVLPGIVIAYAIGIPLAIGAFVAGMFCAVATGYIKEHSRIKEDTIMGVVFSGMFGLGIVLYTKIETNLHLDHILFGDMLGISWSDITETAVIAVITTLIITIKRRDLLLQIFDPLHARAIGLAVTLLHYGLLAMLSLTIVGALKAVGIILAIAMLVAPGSIAFLLTRKFDQMLLLAMLIAVTASIAGIYTSFFIDSAPAPTIVLLMTIIFIVVFVWQTVSNKKKPHSMQ